MKTFSFGVFYFICFPFFSPNGLVFRTETKHGEKQCLLLTKWLHFPGSRFIFLWIRGKKKKSNDERLLFLLTKSETINRYDSTLYSLPPPNGTVECRLYSGFFPPPAFHISASPFFFSLSKPPGRRKKSYNSKRSWKKERTHDDDSSWMLKLEIF